MVGSEKASDNSDNYLRYHGKRRNATTIINRHSWHADNPSSSHSRIDRVNQNPIYSRISTNTRQPHAKDYRWKSGQQPTSTHDRQTGAKSLGKYTHKKTGGRELYSTLNAVGRLKITSKAYKIGDTNDAEVKQLPPSQSFCKIANMEQNVFDLVVKFMQQYFTCFDRSRDELLAAYHSTAIFSMAFNLKGQSLTTKKTTRFGNYVRESRNLVFVNNEEREFEMLHRNNLDIVAWLKKLPITEHISNSFKLDSTFFQPNMLSFSISGVYKEKRVAGEKFTCYRSFHRTFVCVPTSSEQMIIINEQCVISNLSEQQSKIYKQEDLDTETEPIITDPCTSVASTDEELKQNMIKKFSALSNLNLNWSKDCLEFSDWNFEEAERNFFEHKSGIPSEAFIQDLMNTK